MNEEVEEKDTFHLDGSIEENSENSSLVFLHVL
jgi:hypothetical protein